MCVIGQPVERVRVRGCAGGAVQVNLGATTLHLRPDELVLLSRAINTWLLRHPRYLATSHERNDRRSDEPPHPFSRP